MAIKYLDAKRIRALSSDTLPTNIPTNTIAELTDTYAYKWWDGTNWEPRNLWDGARGIFAGGNTYGDQMTYITIATGSNGTDFGNLTQTRGEAGACSNGSRICWGGGQS